MSWLTASAVAVTVRPGRLGVPKKPPAHAAHPARAHRYPGVGETASAAEVRSPPPECAADSTRTVRLAGVLKP